MDQTTAIRLAIDLVQVPSRIRATRSRPLPDGMGLLLRVAAGDEGATLSVADPTGRTPEFLREAATFFIEQILLAPDADSYRVLGADYRCEGPQLRSHMALLLRWLHPDVAGDDDRSIFAARVIAAWDDLKSPERRRAYDAGLRATDGGRDLDQRQKGRRSAGSKSALVLVPGARHQTSSFRRVVRRFLGRTT